MGYQGQNCVRNGGSIEWRGVVIVTIGEESQGRNDTVFRVPNAVVTKERLEYTIEWSRGAGWHPMQHVSINRLTGVGVNYFVDMHGGDTMHCRSVEKKI
jgi:hypothetical protein